MKYSTVFKKGLLIELLFFLTSASAESVANACKNASLPIVTLKYRNGIENIKTIRATALESKLGQELKTYYQSIKYPLPKGSAAQIARNLNQRFVDDSIIKKQIFEIEETANRQKYPVKYVKILESIYRSLMGDELHQFIHLKHPKLIATQFRSANQGEIGQIYGAILKIRKVDKVNFRMDLVVSDEESETIPYLIPLIAHELVHAKSFDQRSNFYEDRKRWSELLILEEAEGFNQQMIAYIKLAQNFPSIFCDWVYPTWSYGEIPVPLSWTMAALEESLASGDFIHEYAKKGAYANEKHLLTADGSRLREDLVAMIVSKNLEYVKIKK